MIEETGAGSAVPGAQLYPPLDPQTSPRGIGREAARPHHVSAAATDDINIEPEKRNTPPGTGACVSEFDRAPEAPLPWRRPPGCARGAP